MAIKIPTVGYINIETAKINEVFDATLTMNQTVGDITPIGVAYQHSVAIHQGWELSASCNYNPQDAAQAALVTGASSGDNIWSNVQFYEDACGVFTGSAILTSATITKSVGSVDKLNLSFVGTGAIAWSPTA